MESTNALSLSWSFGFNKDILGGVHSLADEKYHALFYTSGHTGVIYNYGDRTQRLLQGHCNPISCCCVSEDKRWIVTADKGPDSMIVIWDASNGNPIKTIFKPHEHGVACMDLSPDAMFLVTLSIPGTEPNSLKQEIKIWEWTIKASESAMYQAQVTTEDVQMCVRFNTYDIRELITNGKQRVIFWNWSQNQLQFYSPPLSQKDFKQTIGTFTQSLFVPDSTQAITGTEDGDLIVWDIPHEATNNTGANENVTTIQDKKAIKVVRMCDASKRVAINYMTDMDGYLVLGCHDGGVRFYDFDYRLVAWYEDLCAGPVMSVSFSNVDVQQLGSQQGLYSNNLNNSTVQEEQSRFTVPDFIVATSSAFIIGVTPSIFDEFEVEKRRGMLLMQGINDTIHGMAPHPRLPQLAVSSYSGAIQLWDYGSKRLIMMRKFDTEKLRPHCLLFTKNGKQLIIGFTNGTLKFVDGKTFQDILTFRQTKQPILELRIAHDSSFVALYDAEYYLYLWRSNRIVLHQTNNGRGGSGNGNDSHGKSGSPEANGDGNEDEEENEEQGEGAAEDTDGTGHNCANGVTTNSSAAKHQWTYVGRCKSHSKRITGFEFGISSDSQPLLISVGEDLTMVEYNLNRSSLVDGIILNGGPLKIEYTALPTTCFWHPDMSSIQEDLIVVVNDEYKFKQWNANNKTCRKTTLTPTYGGPLTRVLNVPCLNDTANKSNARYCVYSTDDKVVGMMKLPLDGNPFKSMGLIAHPGRISNVDVSSDGKYFFTAGGADLIVNMWEIHPQVLDLAEVQGGMGIDPYITLLEGGKDGPFYNEIIDYFYFAQVRTQGESTTMVREITNIIPISEISNLMRALGYYPSEVEIQYMCSEIRFSKFIENTKTVEMIDLFDFMKLYVNHRPVFGINKGNIQQAFHILNSSISSNSTTATATGTISGTDTADKEDMSFLPLKWQELKSKLLTTGEKITEEELESCLSALIGNDGMEQSYTALEFADKILGFGDYEQEVPVNEVSDI